MKSSLEAFKRTTNNLGLPDVRLFFTDNPSGDKNFYPEELPSLRAQQEKFDALCDGDAIATVQEGNFIVNQGGDEQSSHGIG